VFETLRRDWRNIIIGAFSPLASFALFHMVTVFPLSWIFLNTQQKLGRFLIIEILASFIGIATMMVSGIIADKIGRRTLLGAGAVVIAAFSGFAPQLLGAGEVGQIVFMFLGFALLGISFGQSSGTVASRFQKKYRYTGSAFTSDLAWLFGAGFAPYAALALASHFGLIASGAYLLSGAICTLAALTINRQLGQSGN
jgi:MFS family permease